MTRNSSFPTGGIPKKKTAGPIDIMRPGNGTPWEDRGTTGALVAYFKTAAKSITSPGLLMDHIRRPETTDDASSFATVSMVMWFFGVLAWHAYWRFIVFPKGQTGYISVDSKYYWLTAVLEGAMAAGGIFLFLKVGPRLFRSLGATELKTATPSLIYNCFAYSFGPSIFAIIPVFGWGLAALLIFIDLIVAGKRRLYMKASGAIVNIIILYVIVIAVGTVLFFLFPWIWGGMLDMNGLTVKPPGM